MHQRYIKAAPPRKGERASLAYRLRRLFGDRSKLWPRLTRYRKWNESKRRITNTWMGLTTLVNGQALWWIKERYRSMRGDIRPC
jgi:hypothetical protein